MIDFLKIAPARLLSGRKLVGRAVVLSGGRGVASVLSAVWVILVARNLPLDQFGEVSVALALIVVLTSLSDFGLQFILAKDVVDVGYIRRGILDVVIAGRLLLGVVFALLMVVLFVIATHDGNLAVPLVFSLSIVGAGLYNPTITAYRATGNIRRVIDYLWVRGKSVPEPAGQPRPRLPWRAAVPFTLASTVGAVYTRVDNYLVSLLRGTAAAGIYRASYRFNDLNLLLPSALGQLALSEAAGQDPSTRLATGKRVAAQSVLLSLGPAVVVSVFASQLLTLLFGARYAVAAPVVIVLMVSTLPGAAAIAIQGLTGVTDPRRFAVATAGSLALNVVANLILIPPFSGLGAAWANVISQGFLAAAYYYVLWRKTGELKASLST
ncbi:MAG: hypothetical protein E6I04_00175 [Chloroflexi bacterium]|nr:MAG: hypothetical protein E6I04_00175 [Chloroflexota bacterium]